MGDMSMEEVVAEQKAILIAIGDGGVAPWILKREGHAPVVHGCPSLEMKVSNRGARRSEGAEVALKRQKYEDLGQTSEAEDVKFKCKAAPPSRLPNQVHLAGGHPLASQEKELLGRFGEAMDIFEDD